MQEKCRMICVCQKKVVPLQPKVAKLTKLTIKTLDIMPQISTFYGIIIFMNFQDHAPAHFHAWYGDYKIMVSIKDGVVKGEMPGRALRMVLEWLDLHRDELLENWDRAQNGEMVKHIVPLK